MIDTLCHVLQCTTLKETIKCMVCGLRKLCMAIPMHASKVMHCQPQPQENTNIERKSFQLHLMQQDVFVPYEKHMIKYFKESYHALMKRYGFSIENLPRESYTGG